MKSSRVEDYCVHIDFCTYCMKLQGLVSVKVNKRDKEFPGR